eukprot:TRINITY_DN2982_c0_g1_i1.p2 TRINITY_DN2982_c0_g1~~TRINITY_DN2982_c0_g1_i1.p2  ORF type:complete len:139 (-),score=29.83 TRINITY_DN2982_c0_g1_i1:522-938(-)
MTNPKKLYDTKGTSKVSNGTDFVEYAKVIVKAFNDNKSLVFDDAWKSIAALSCQRAKIEALQLFEDGMSAVCANITHDGITIESEDLEGVYKSARDEGMELYVQRAVSGPPAPEVQKQLAAEIKDQLVALETQKHDTL